jgi:hypothetical protein
MIDEDIAVTLTKKNLELKSKIIEMTHTIAELERDNRILSELPIEGKEELFVSKIKLLVKEFQDNFYSYEEDKKRIVAFILEGICKEGSEEYVIDKVKALRRIKDYDLHPIDMSYG